MTDAEITAALAARTPMFAQGSLLHGPDTGGIDVGYLLGEVYDPKLARAIVIAVNLIDPLMRVAEAARVLLAHHSGDHAYLACHTDDHTPALRTALADLDRAKELT